MLVDGRTFLPDLGDMNYHKAPSDWLLVTQIAPTAPA